MAKKKKNEIVSEIIRPEDVLANKKFSQSLIDEMKSDTNIFLVAQARREMERVVSLTKTIDKMQEMYQEKAIEYMMDNNDQSALEYLPTMLETLSSCLDRSYALIKEVINNEKIMNFSIVQNNISDSDIQIGTDNIITGALDDPKSRERVRRAVSEILASLPNPEQEEGGN